MKQRICMITGAIILVIVMLTGLFMKHFEYISLAGNITYKQGSSVNDIVTVMQSYGFITFGTLDTSGHQHMNAVANTLGSGSLTGEFNIRESYENCDTTTYIQHFANLNGTVKIGHSGDTLYVGSEYTVSGEGQKRINDSYVVESATNVYADTATEKYMDLEQLQQSFISYSAQLAEHTTDDGVELDGESSINKISITKSSGAAYLNLDATSLNKLNQDAILDFPTDSTSVVVINIDMKDASWNRKPIVLKIGGQDVSCGEDVYTSNINRIYYNFYDSSEADGQYIGSINMTDKGWGTILAPKASTTVGSNFCGVIVSNNVTATGESHRSNAYNPVIPKKVGGVISTPSEDPTKAPSEDPTKAPSVDPTKAPSVDPTKAPSVDPTKTPSEDPTKTPPEDSTKALSEDSAKPATAKPAAKSDMGKLLITVLDEETGDSVPNAKVVVKDSNGKKRVYTTDTNGQIKINQIAVGKTEITVKKVPVGYTVKTDKTKTVNVEKNKTTKETVKVGNSKSSNKTKVANDDKVSNSSSNEPETGDWYHASVPMALLIFSLIGVIVLYITNKRWERR